MPILSCKETAISLLHCQRFIFTLMFDLTPYFIFLSKYLICLNKLENWKEKWNGEIALLYNITFMRARWNEQMTIIQSSLVYHNRIQRHLCGLCVMNYSPYTHLLPNETVLYLASLSVFEGQIFRQLPTLVPSSLNFTAWIRHAGYIRYIILILWYSIINA